jgi:outer membrane lipoprotein
MKWWFHSTLILLLLNGCASNLPSAIREAPAEPLSVRQAQQDPEAFRGREVRWGGEIIEVRNAEDHSDVVVLGRELKSRGEPLVDGAVDGRFIARFGGFVDPAELSEGKRITVRGRVVGLESHNVGQFPYPYPVVEVMAWHLWPDPEPYPHYYDPWWPYYPYPYYWGRPWGHPYWWW